MLAKRNLEISRIVRSLDDVPSRAELVQYERRFAELYEEVAGKLEENRKYVDVEGCAALASCSGRFLMLRV